MHNGYGSQDGAKLEDDIQKALDDAEIPNTRGQKIFDENGVQKGEIDLQTDNWIIEATVGKSSKLKQINKYFSKLFNPNGKSVVLIGTNYKNSAAVKAIEETGAKVVHSIEDLMKLIK